MQGGFFNNQSDPLNLNPTDEEEEEEDIIQEKM
jgi:hypothetical protein